MQHVLLGVRIYVELKVYSKKWHEFVIHQVYHQHSVIQLLAAATVKVF